MKPCKNLSVHKCIVRTQKYRGKGFISFENNVNKNSMGLKEMKTKQTKSDPTDNYRNYFENQL
jgi:hypothetical protein